MLHISLEYAGVWDLVKTRSPRFAPLMTYNTPTAESLYLNTVHASSNFVLSESLKELRQARYHYGKTYEQFLKITYDCLKLPVFLCQGETKIEDTLSPQRAQTERKITYKMWAEEENWVQHLTTAHSGRVPSNVTTIVRQMFVPKSAGKRKWNGKMVARGRRRRRWCSPHE
jgi:hypothetical protein